MLAAAHAEPSATTTTGDARESETLESLAMALAARQSRCVRGDPTTGVDLLARLGENARQLVASYRNTAAAFEAGRWISPAGEWLLDNFHIVNEQLRESREDLPRRFYRELPRVPDGPYAGLPRAYAVASELIEHTEGRLDIAALERFLGAYQTVTPLAIGELWAIPIALRHAFLDRLAALAVRVDVARHEREAAAALADELATIAARGPAKVAEVLARRVGRRARPSTTMFATELLLRLRDQDPALGPAAAWLQQRITEQGTTLEEAARTEHLSQAANVLSVGNAITAMRTITATDWTVVFEHQSLVEGVLREDPSGDYGRMDFATRDRYRHAIERLGKRTRMPEPAVARRAIDLARGAALDAASDPRRAHVGYYLVDQGLPALERACGYRPRVSEHLGRLALSQATALYLGGIALCSAVVAASLALWTIGQSASPVVTAVVSLVGLLAGSELGVGLVNLCVSAIRRPRLLPKLDLRGGLPSDCRTLVAVPVLLCDEAEIADLVEALEVRFLANQDRRLHFALLTDFGDAATEETPRDEALLAAATAGLRRLEEKYGPHRFFLLHRTRRWCAGEGLFMGWERKRGKLVELNQLLLGDASSGVTAIVGDPAALAGVRYVIALDADTRLPRDAAIRLVGTMAHPLNRPRLDPTTALVVEGYGILQPRVSVALESSRRTRFARLFSHQPGIDPYTTAVSDVYQDLFGEGSFVGKGIYDVRAFSAALDGRVPVQTLLSHDLLEGLFARAGLVSDIELFDDAPSRYLSHSQRRHRWIRGDWQVTPWLSPGTRSDGGVAIPPLSAIARWKIVDNLRRSLVPVAILLLLLLGWAALPSPLLWTGVVAGLVAFPVLSHWIGSLLLVPDRVRWGPYVAKLGRETLQNVGRALLALVFLPHEAWVSVDAIVRVAHRRTVSQRKLLEWVTAAQTETNGGGARPRRALLAAMGPVLAVVGAALAAAVVLQGPPVLAVAPLALAWLLSPLLVVWLDRPPATRLRPVTAVERHFLRRTARKTWHYFDTFVTAADHFLPPDNFQEDPAPLLAHRTSPTNIGLALLSTVTALDLGYIGVRDCVLRLERTLATVERLERHRGHFLNWYDTTTLAPLLPRYISTVDSGNLAGMLLTLKQACLERTALAGEASVIAAGLVDTLRLLEDAIDDAADPVLAVLESDTAALIDLLGPAPHPAPSLDDLRVSAAGICRAAHSAALGRPSPAMAAVLRWSDALLAQVDSHHADGAVDDGLRARLEQLAARADALHVRMEFGFLYHAERKVFSIGFDVQAVRLDASYYDLLASEARIASFVAIAKGDVPVEHWFRLGRPLAQVGLDRALLSWTGTMFEYLMPSLLLRDYPGTLLAETAHAVVKRQIAYGRECRAPWGISEAAYNGRDLQLNYQYGPFGVPGLGIRRGLGDELVVAPYATALALAVDPHAAVENLWRLSAEGLEGDYGFYESIDFTPGRVPKGQRGAVVRTFMSHHGGMTLVAISEYLGGRRMCARFHAEPSVKATELLLQERVPRDAPLEPLAEQEIHRTRAPRVLQHEPWCALDPAAPPVVHLLSNGGYSVMVTGAGGGYSRCRGLAVTRWREDPTRDHCGQFGYVRDRRSGARWSTTHQPTPDATRRHEFCFSIDKAEFRQLAGGIETHVQVSVSTEDDAETRAVTLTNVSGARRELEVTSYAELVLASPAADAAHPAFSNLFVETELLPDHHALLATRRRRADGEPHVFAVHVSAVDGTSSGVIEHETDRERFLGRYHGARDPIALTEDRPLSGTVGSVLDPIFSLRRHVIVEPGEAVRVLFTTAVADTRERAVALADKYAVADAVDRASVLAWTYAQSQLHYLDIEADEARTYRALAALLLYSSRQLRAREDVIARNQRGQAGLWAHGVSGDLPILLLRLDGDEHVDLLRSSLRAHEYLRLRGLPVDLVVLIQHAPTYLLSFMDQLQGIVRGSPSAGLLDKPGGIFLRRTDVMAPEDETLLLAAARAILVGGRGTLTEQIERLPHPYGSPPPRPRPFFGRLASVADHGTPSARIRRALSPVVARSFPASPLPPPRPQPAAAALRCWNGLGGFTDDGREYVLRLEGDRVPPAPWSNVLANPGFGALVTESGGGYEWADNSHENRLTRWSNDPVSDPASTAIYVRDEDTGDLWTPTPLPIRDGQPRVVRHGQGYTVFEATLRGIEHQLTIFVPVEDPVKVARLVLRNRSGARRRLTVTGYVEWTLGVLREESARHVVTSVDTESGALLARNTYPGDLGARVAFFAALPRATAWTGDRAEFLGRHGDPSSPAALGRTTLSGRVGAGHDPCAALQVEVTLAPGAEQEVVFTLGQTVDLAGAQRLLARHRQPEEAARALALVRDRWDELLGAVQIETPDFALDVLVNRWLLYQVTACRVWGRTGFYQSGGAYGFRDQLQDVAALGLAAPAEARAHLLRAASRQFLEGDVQHWWHPPTGRGVRTRFADDCLWLPFITAHHVQVTGDAALLDEQVPFLEARALAAGEHEAFLLPTVSSHAASLYEHCVRAIDRSLAVGAHGLPLMGGGDWNDGMNRVGIGGSGESVWMAWFLQTVIDRFAPLCEARGDAERATRYREHAARLKIAVEQKAWDGDWYLRAFFDDGTPLGSARGDECRIDSLSQSWSVISRAGDPVRAARALASVSTHLVDRAARLVKLLAPPFDRGAHDPGYIKGYVPGVRENGGQYTHAAAWVVLAHTLLGDGDRAAALLELLNPVHSSSTPAALARYRVEPYVIVADVASVPPHVGRGGWTWYTGSASWIYRVTVESLLGLQISGSELRVDPCIPRSWPGFSLTYRHGRARYHIRVSNPEQVCRGVVRRSLDGAPFLGAAIPLVDDGALHEVEVVLGLPVASDRIEESA